MNKQEYLKRIDELNLEKDQYYIYGGGLLLMYDLISETKDIDLVINHNYLEILKKQYPLVKEIDDCYQYDSNIDFIIKDDNNLDNTIDGYQLYSLIKYRDKMISLNRTKDIDKIDIINKYLDANKL